MKKGLITVIDNVLLIFQTLQLESKFPHYCFLMYIQFAIRARLWPFNGTFFLIRDHWFRLWMVWAGLFDFLQGCFGCWSWRMNFWRLIFQIIKSAKRILAWRFFGYFTKLRGGIIFRWCWIFLGFDNLLHNNLVPNSFTQKNTWTNVFVTVDLPTPDCLAWVGIADDLVWVDVLLFILDLAAIFHLFSPVIDDSLPTGPSGLTTPPCNWYYVSENCLFKSIP